ncbi:hypothetical protein L9F63_004308, partial [Diploptera punctata]
YYRNKYLINNIKHYIATCVYVTVHSGCCSVINTRVNSTVSCCKCKFIIHNIL